jgi:hypothetical protein
VLNLIWLVAQWLLFIAIVLFFVSPLLSDARRAWKFRFSAVGIVAAVTVMFITVLEIRLHPILSVVALTIAAFTSYGVLEFRKHLKRRKPEPWVEYLNLRSTGKRPVNLDDHPDVFDAHDDDASAEEAR